MAHVGLRDCPDIRLIEFENARAVSATAVSIDRASADCVPARPWTSAVDYAFARDPIAQIYESISNDIKADLGRLVALAKGFVDVFRPSTYRRASEVGKVATASLNDTSSRKVAVV